MMSDEGSLSSSRTNSSTNDVRFISFLIENIEQELSVLNENSYSYHHREKYLIFRDAFNKILNYVQVYKNLLQSIKREYEFCIDELEKQNKRRDDELDQLNKLDGSHLTINNLQQRKQQLLIKFESVSGETERLRAKLNSLLENNEQFRPKLLSKYSFLNPNKKPVNNEDNDDKKKLIPNLSLEKATDLEYLSHLLTQIEAKINELNATQAKKYTNKQQKQEMETLLYKKISTKEDKIAESKSIKSRIFLQKLALNIAKEYYSENARGYSSIQDALAKGLLNAYMSRKNAKEIDEQLVDEDDDDGILEDDSLFILDYIERFNDLFEDGKYEAAAYYAVASPKNILRNLETLNRFKDVSNRSSFSEDLDPLLIFSNALIDSISDTAPKPNEEMSKECVRVALKFNKLDLLTRWIAQRKLTLSYTIGKHIQSYARRNARNAKNSFELALFVFKDIGAKFETAICLAKLGRYAAMLDLITIEQETFNSVDPALKILKECPSLELAFLLVDHYKSDQLSTDRVVSIFLDSDQPENGLKFLEEQIERLASHENSNNEELDKMKTSYQTLMKFSFLAQDEDQLANEAKHDTSEKLHNIYFMTKSNVKPSVNKLAAASDANRTI